MVRRILALVLGAAAIGVLLLTAACSNKNNKSANLNPNGATVIVPTRLPTNTPIPPAQRIGTVAVSPSAIAATGAQSLTEVATDNKFSQTNFTVKAGEPIELTLTNNGDAIHNWHLLNVKDIEGKDILTPFVDPHKSTTIDFTIKTPGTYNFQCDVHPADMKGTLTVQ